MSTKIIERNVLSLRVKALATVSAVAGAVVLPQLFHLLGSISGTGTVPGEVFLPMHLPILLVGLLAGPLAGAVSGFVSPLLSFALTGMPTAVMLPFMMIELLSYGFFAGLMRNVRMPLVGKVLFAQLAGRAVRALFIVVAVFAFSRADIQLSTVWMSIVKGLPGLCLQWAFLPLIVYRIEHSK
ncbi:MAG: ECF transporter S component [Ruminococcaceae bacterium]|nr:ECF transporter S component [Oscillospiraceae bacterium]